jgi:hypothetical protein
MMRRRIIAGLLALLLPVGVPGMSALGQDAARKEPLGDTEQAIVDALTRTLELLSRTFDQVMIYEVPELLPNGDIIIRRRRPKPDRPEVIQPAPDTDKIRL